MWVKISVVPVKDLWVCLKGYFRHICAHHKHKLIIKNFNNEKALRRPGGGINYLFNQNWQNRYCKRPLAHEKNS